MAASSSGGWEEDVVFQGWINKKGKFRKNWNRRWIVLRRNRTFQYYERPGGPLKGSGKFNGHVKQAFEDAGRTIVFYADDHTGNPRGWRFQFANESEEQFWQEFAKNPHATNKYVDTSKFFNILVIGGIGVGKTSICMQFIHKVFPEEHNPTIENVFNKGYEVDGEPQHIRLTDTAGQDEFTVVNDAWNLQCDGCIFVFAIDDKRTFDDMHLYRERMEAVRESSIRELPVVIVGNKSDLVNNRQVTTQELEAIGNEFDCPTIECSALKNSNIEAVFQEAIREIRRLNPNIEKSNPSDPSRNFCTIA